MSKVIWIDTETTGLDAEHCGMTAIGFIIEVDGVEVEKEVFDIDPRTYRKKVHISDEALKIQGKTVEDFKGMGYSQRTFEVFLSVLGKHIDKFDKKDKYVIKGYNVGFDIEFIKAWFIDCGYEHFGSWFSYKEVDVFALVKVLKDQNMFESESDKLMTLCIKFGIELMPHNALDDIVATKKLYTILTDKYINEVSDDNKSIQER